MNTFWKYLQYGYLVIGALFFIEGILKFNSDKEEAFIMFGFGIFITLIFFFKRHFRRKLAKRNQQQ
ncbi:hypothetical protein J2Q11_02855 [Tenacibaculum finnmarkense genomovar finnmarkense]|uniref:Gliding motility protein GldL n=2 Tax=Tenacibaculum finnmarkense TaxID=2781243 RepID=A0A2I2M8C5_9FLAO|nr:hypothetical protein [Tenacibaculum finnmarkense]ALU75605.1 hypothetical protein AUW17_10220 [Tenacibaculum dicentrarchi]MBE7633029.1 hypothetical protein [Tenacibaculum finnmarkense genomovar ulcerans]MBE7644681.1 hypothetical protein [Tenacibaculum finnmarkense genomovar ulcerans]MBE7651892.1 hypothetical protein [Tenacibaculum finnmarkense genomovar finnmarkense]MBE7659146.1 hypothetical protein [Tenacibaculum finnmarkense genomovar finnmarkense]